MDFISRFDRNETPEHTADRQGFFWFKDLVTNDSEATLTCLIRDFETDGFHQRKRRIAEVKNRIRVAYPTGNVHYEVTDINRNIAASLVHDDRAVGLLFQVMDELGIEKKLIPMRGGTDGAVLSARGVTTPNFFTVAYNFHSRYEFLPVAAFEKSFEVALGSCRLAAAN